MRRSRAHLRLHTLYAILLAAAAPEPIQADTVQDLLNTSNDYLELVREHWARIRLGDAQSMAVAYDALNNCSHFQDAIARAETIDDLDALLAHRGVGNHSPAQFLLDALSADFSMAYSAIGGMGVDTGIRTDPSPEVSVAWQLVACEIRGDCANSSSMRVFCAFMTPECAQWSNAFEYLEHEAGGEVAFREAQAIAGEIRRMVQE